MMEMPRAEWKSREEFAEVAEAIGVPTDHIMAVRWGGGDGDCIALWSADELAEALETVVFATVLRRDSAGILTVAVLPRRVGVVGEFLPPREGSA